MQNEDTYKAVGATSFPGQMMKLLRYGRLFYRASKADDYRPWDWPIAVALSHGGRLLVEFDPVMSLEKGEWGIWLISQLVGGPDKLVELYHRSMATHEIDRLSTPETINAGSDVVRKTMKEGKPLVTKMQTGGTVHFGINLALGGYQQTNIWGQDSVTPNGQHGHAYVLFKPAHDGKPGGLLIGVEGSESGQYAATGDFHGMAADSAAVSVAGGLKFKQLVKKSTTPPPGGKVIPNGSDTVYMRLTAEDQEAIFSQADIDPVAVAQVPAPL